MAVYLVTWKLNRGLGRGEAELDALRAGLAARLEAYPYIHDEEFESVYFLSTEASAGRINADLHAGLDKDDKLVVARLTDGAYCGWLPKPVWDWIEERL